MHCRQKRWPQADTSASSGASPHCAHAAPPASSVAASAARAPGASRAAAASSPAPAPAPSPPPGAKRGAAPLTSLRARRQPQQPRRLLGAGAGARRSQPCRRAAALRGRRWPRARAHARPRAQSAAPGSRTPAPQAHHPSTLRVKLAAAAPAAVACQAACLSAAFPSAGSRQSPRLPACRRLAVGAADAGRRPVLMGPAGRTRGGCTPGAGAAAARAC